MRRTQKIEDPVIAHAELIRAVDRLLGAARIVEEKRDALDDLVSRPLCPVVANEQARRADGVQATE